MAAGAEYEIKLAGLGARDTLRLEAKFPLYGNDLTDTTNPIEAGLSWVVKLGAADFIGKAALTRVKAEGPSRRLRGLVLEGKGVLRAGYSVFAGDKHVGTTTSGGVAPTLDASIGLAYISVPECKEKRLEVQIRDRRVPVQVTRKPFYNRA
jgi:aminomethyltransferase